MSSVMALQDNRSVVMAIILLTVVFTCYYNSLQCGFVFDDLSAIVENHDLRSETPILNLFRNDFWGTPMQKESSHKSYRPLCVLTFRLNYAVHQLQPMGYHLLNALLHSFVCIIFFRVCRMLLPYYASVVAAILFAVHPIHTEAVTGVVGRAELLSSIFYLTAIITYAKCAKQRRSTKWRYFLLTVLSVVMAMLCKEQGITVVGVCFVYEVFVIQKLTVFDLWRAVSSVGRRGGGGGLPPWLRPVVSRTAALVGATLLLLIARVRVMGATLPVFTSFDNPASTAAAPTRLLTYNYLLAVNSWLLLCPLDLLCDWTMGTIPLLRGVLDPRNLATVAFYVVFGCLTASALSRQGPRQRGIVMGLAMTIFPFVPALNLFFPVGFVVAERILYLPSMGVCMLIGLGAQLLYSQRRLRLLYWTGLALLLLTHSMKTVSRNYDWVSEYSLFQAGLRVTSRNAKLFNNVGHSLENKQDHAQALEYFQRAVSVQPDDIGAHMNVGRALRKLNQTAAAEEAYQRALSLFPSPKKGKSYTTRIAPNYLNIFISLASIIAQNESRLAEADALLSRAIGMRRDFTKAYINRGDILMKLGKAQAAEEHYQMALRYENDNPDIHYNLGVVCLERKQLKEAMENFDRALALNPNHVMTLFNSAIILQDQGLPASMDKAYERLVRLLHLDSENERVPFNLGMLSMDKKQYDDALIWFNKAIQMKPDFSSALFNIALMLVNDLERPLEALPYLEKLLVWSPDHTKGLLLLGDVQLNSQHDPPAAERTFRAALAVAPPGSRRRAHVQHSLCVALVSRGALAAGRTCLVEAARLDPTAENVREHLVIVEARIRDAAAAAATATASAAAATASAAAKAQKKRPPQT